MLVPTTTPIPDLPPGLNVTDVLNAIGSKQWLVLVMLVAVYGRKLMSNASAFPVTISPNVRPVITGGAGLVIAVVSCVQAGGSWTTAILVGITGGALTTFVDGLVVALFGSPASAPAWARWCLAIIDEVDPKGGPGGKPAIKVEMTKDEAVARVSSVPPPHPPAPAPQSSFPPEPPKHDVLGIHWPWPRPRKKRPLGRFALPIATGIGYLSFSTGAVMMSVGQTACTPAQAANFETSLSKILSYAASFLPLVQTAWTTFILPLIGSGSAGQATVDFNNAFVTFQNAVAVAQDANAAAQTPSNVAALVADIQSATQALDNVILQWTTGSKDAGAVSTAIGAAPIVLSEVHHQAAVLVGWKL
jgi:hypothetical protein